MKNHFRLITHAITGAICLALGFLIPLLFSEKNETMTGKSESSSFQNRELKKRQNRIEAKSLTEQIAENKRRLPERQSKEMDPQMSSGNPKSLSSAEPQITIPFKGVVQVMRLRFQRLSEFINIGHNSHEVLRLLGATESEEKEIVEIFDKSKKEILAAEKTHVKVGKITEHSIELDTSGMSEVVSKVIEQTKEGIRTSLPAGSAEAFISAIPWEKYYGTDPDYFPVFTIERIPSGLLSGWVRSQNGSFGHALDRKFQDNGQPIPVDEAFEDRTHWKPFLKGLTLLPVDMKLNPPFDDKN